MEKIMARFANFNSVVSSSSKDEDDEEEEEKKEEDIGEEVDGEGNIFKDIPHR